MMILDKNNLNIFDDKSLVQVRYKVHTDLKEGGLVSFHLIENSPFVRGMMGPRDYMNEVFPVMMSDFLFESFMNSWVNKLSFVLNLNKGKNEFPIALKVRIFFKMNLLPVFCHYSFKFRLYLSRNHSLIYNYGLKYQNQSFMVFQVPF